MEPISCEIRQVYALEVRILPAIAMDPGLVRFVDGYGAWDHTQPTSPLPEFEYLTKQILLDLLGRYPPFMPTRVKDINNIGRDAKGDIHAVWSVVQYELRKRKWVGIEHDMFFYRDFRLSEIARHVAFMRHFMAGFEQKWYSKDTSTDEAVTFQVNQSMIWSGRA